MANGASLGVLQMMKEITKDATPAYKVEPYGVLASLLTAHSPGVIKNDSYDGHYKTVKVKKKRRFTSAHVDPSPSCDHLVQQTYSEDTVSVGNFRQLAFHIEDEVIAAFDDYASKSVAFAKATPGISQPPITDLMFEFADTLMTAASALLASVDQKLCDLAVAAIGVNRNGGVSTSQSVNIPLATTNNPLSDGITRIMRDFKYNNMMGKPIVVGAGLFEGFMLNQAAIGGPNQAGIDTRIQAAGFDFWRDYNLANSTALNNANQIIVYEKDAIQLVEYMQNQGFKAGVKPGASQFGVLVLPMMVGDQLVPVKFDFQLRYNDCDESVTLYDTGSSTTVHRGYNLILSKNFGLYTIPTDAYGSADVLYGNRGSLRYTITNT